MKFVVWIILLITCHPNQPTLAADSGLEIAPDENLARAKAYDSSDQASGPNLRLLRITPHGADVVAGNQIVFQFDRPVVPVGKMDRNAHEIPVTIEPKLLCEWRWLNTSALACQLRDQDKMRLATTYKVTMLPGITTSDGISLFGRIDHRFTTSRPRVTYSRFVNWLSPGTPLIQVTFNQPVTKRSVERALKIVAGNDPVTIVAYSDNLPRRLPWSMMITDEQNQPMVDDQFALTDDDAARRIWVIEPVRELPLATTVSLKVIPGLQSSEGAEPGIEARIVVTFDTYPEFKFFGIRCTLKGDSYAQNILFETLQRKKHNLISARRCAPLKPVALLFSSPVQNSMVKQHVAFTPALNGGRKDYDPWENTHDWTRLNSPHAKNRMYQRWLPELLRAYQEYTVQFDVSNLADEFGRKLDHTIDFSFFTDHREPNLKLRHAHAVLEKGVDSDVPLYVTNLDEVRISYTKLGDRTTESDLVEKRQINRVEDISYPVPMEVRKLLGDDTGVLFGRVHPVPAPPNWYQDPTILAQVTPYQIHFKAGHFNSLAWVTDFAQGEPVSSATIALFKGKADRLDQLTALGITGTTDKNGLLQLPGLADIDPDLQLIYGRNGTNLFAKVEKDGDIALLPLTYGFAVRGNGAYTWLRKAGSHTHAWGTTAQGIYKLGDTIEFKIYVREQSNRAWVSPAKSGYSLVVQDPQGKSVFEKRDLRLSEFGAFDGSFKVPEVGSVGWYRFILTPTAGADEKQPRMTWAPLSVLVSDFTPASFKVKTELNGVTFGANDKVEVTALATLHAGGPFTNAEVRLTARLRVKPFKTKNPIATGFTFGSRNESALSSTQSKLLDVRDSLNNLGQYQDSFTLPETDIYFGSLMVESAVKDDRGKFVTASASADYAGRTRFAGIRNTRWLYKKGEVAELEILVVDAAGNLIEGADVTVQISRRDYKAARVKGPGNAYVTQNIMQWVEHSSCAVRSANAAVICAFTPSHPGYYQFVATTRDDADREHKTTVNGWATGAGSVVWDQSNDATLQIIPEQTNYKIGDTARYLIKNPFPGAKALVSVERYGVIDSWIETLDTSTPVIEVPIRPDYLPGFYLSVVAVSPRVAMPLGPGKVDLGKPSYRIGYVAAQVTDPYKQLTLDITTDRELYRPREKVSASIHVEPRAGKNAEPIEIAIAVVDEAVLAMNQGGKAYYDPYAGFNRLDALDVGNYSLLSRLVGRQKFEKKGANPGGDGGVTFTQMRNLFKFVSYWNPSLIPDAAGNARIEFEVPDNLTGWRILALAVTPNDRMGLGDTAIKVNRPTEIRPVMPNQVIEGDEFKAGFTVMNRTAAPRELKVFVTVDGALASRTRQISSFDLIVAPYERESIWLPLQTKGAGELVFVVHGGDKSDRDAIKYRLTVNKRRSLETAATYGTTTRELVTESIKVPDGIYTDVGEIGAVLSPTVIGNIDGAFNYIKNYPHMCWEQRLTKAVFAASYLALHDYLGEDVEWPKAELDVANALRFAANFQAPNGGMAYWIPSNQHVSPYLSAYSAIAFNWLRRSGHEIPGSVEERLHQYLLALLRRDDFPTFYSKGMASSVRAIALAALSESGKVTHDDIERYDRHVPEMDLFGKSHFLQAAIKTADVDGRIVTKTIDSILGHASQSGGKFQFNEAWDDSYKYLLATPLRSNCTVLSSLLDAQMRSKNSRAIGDIPFKLVRSITQGRGSRDRWENTQENVFCLNALIDYAKIYEAEDPAMQVTVEFDDVALGATAFSAKTDPAVNLFRPISATDPGKSAKLKITKQGTGRLYYSARIAYDLLEDNRARINSGIEIRREYAVERDGKFVLLHSPMAIRRGELVRVDLFVSIPSARHFVVVNDPIPGGLEAINTDFATTSTIDAEKGHFKAAAESWFFNYSDWSYYGRHFWSFYHKELRHDSARFYADYLPAGNYHLSYTAQAIAEGKFSVMPVHAEEMYDPDVYGKGLSSILQVAE